VETDELRPWITRLAWLLVGLGVVARIVRYAADRSLWRDECALAVNVLERSFAGLLRPLDDQVAPLGFLVLSKATVSLFGSSEYALRLVPLAAGLASLPLFHLAVREFLGRGEAAVALMLFSLSEPLIFYSSEVKQYASDVLACTAILLLGARILCRGMTWPRLLGFAVTGIAGVWISIPAAFACAAAGAALLLVTLRAKRWPAVLGVGLTCAACLASFASHYRLFQASARAAKNLEESWDAFVVPAPGFRAEVFEWYRKSSFAVFNDPLGFPSTEIAAAVFLVGAVVLFRRRPLSSSMLLAPIGLALLAGMLGRMPFPVSDEHHLLERTYPFYGRLLLFSAPSFLAAMGAGLAFLLRSSDARRNFLGPIVVVLLLAMPVFQCLRNTLSPPEIQETRPLIEAVARSFQPGDQIYSQTFAALPVRYYTRRAGLPDAAGELRLRNTRRDQEKLRRQIEALPPGTRIWLVTLHHPHWDSEAELADIRVVLKPGTERLEQLKFTNCEASLYRVR
jgi:hypothetical protein